MAVQAGEAYIPIRADMDQFSRDVKSGSAKATGSLGSFAKKAAGLMAGAFAVSAASDFFSGAIDGARESAKINALTESTIKSMGGAAGLTASQVADLSTKLSNVTGVDDEVIQGGANLLLTFGNISSKGGVFDKTLALANDMSVALGQDMKSSSIQLGKALNDPIKGVSALSRVGVSFTEQQKEQIKAMAESGDLLGAQGIILEEVGKQFGGAAEAASTPMDKFKVTIGNLQEELGARLIPVIDSVVGWLAKKLPGAIDTVSGAFSFLGDLWGAVIEGFEFGVTDQGGILGFFAKIGNFVYGTVLPALRDMQAWWTQNSPQIIASIKGIFETLTRWAGIAIAVIVEKVLPAFVDFGRILVERVLPVIVDLFEWIKGNKYVLVGLAAAVGVTLVAAFVAWAIAAGTAALATLAAIAPVLLVGAAIAGLVAGIYFVWDNWQDIWGKIRDFVGSALGAVVEFVKGLPQRAMSALSSTWATLSGYWSTVFGQVKQFASDRIGDVVQFFRDLPGKGVAALQEGAQVLINAGRWIVEKALEGINQIKTLAGWFTSLPGKALDWVLEGADKLLQIGKDIVSHIVKGIKAAPGAIGDAISGILPDSVGGFKLPWGDGPGAPARRAAGGSALRRVQAVLGDYPGAMVSSTYRDPARNRRAGGSPTSYHMDRNNPAVDIAGPTAVLDRIAARLRSMGGWREFIWRAPGHYDHIHVAHQGGVVQPWGIEKLRSDELLTKLQVGETVLPAGFSGAGGGGLVIENAYFNNPDPTGDLDWYARTRGAGV